MAGDDILLDENVKKLAVPEEFGFIVCRIDRESPLGTSNGEKRVVGVVCDLDGNEIFRGVFPQKSVLMHSTIKFKIAGERDGYYLIKPGPIPVPKEIVSIPEKPYGKCYACEGEVVVTSRVNNVRLLYCSNCDKVISFFAFCDW